MRIVPIAMQKGGPGKMTTTMNLAAVTAKGGSRTLVVDSDPQGSTTWWAENGGEHLPFDFAPDVDPRNLSRLRELPYDVVFVDTPGNLEATATLAAVLDVADFVVLPLSPAGTSGGGQRPPVPPGILRLPPAGSAPSTAPAVLGHRGNARLTIPGTTWGQ